MAWLAVHPFLALALAILPTLAVIVGLQWLLSAPPDNYRSPTIRDNVRRVK
jgi:hypothetical protein